MYNVHIEVASLVYIIYIYVYVGSKTIFFPVLESYYRFKQSHF